MDIGNPNKIFPSSLPSPMGAHSLVYVLWDKRMNATPLQDITDKLFLAKNTHYLAKYFNVDMNTTTNFWISGRT